MTNEHFTPEELYNIEQASPTEIFTLHAWDADAYEKGCSITQALKEILPALEVYFIGSLALKLDGANDIDINVYCEKCNPETLKEHAQKIIAKYGDPVRMEPSLVQWCFVEGDTSIDIILYNDMFEGAKEQLEHHQLLETSSELRRKYEELKRTAEGESVREYVRRKILFFKSFTS